MEHFCRDCKSSNGSGNTCTWTGATHTTGIECPSFRAKEKEVEMFKIGDRVKVIADEERLGEIGATPNPIEGEIIEHAKFDTHIPWLVDVGPRTWWFAAKDLELVEPEPAFEARPEGALEVKESEPGESGSPIRTFDSGATRDTAQGKLDYVKALSPIVLRRYVQYLDKHRLQPDGSYRDFDNWKKGIPQEAYISGGGRHFMDTWLLTEGYVTEDNHGPVEIEDAICAQLFNLMGRLHEILQPVVDRTTPVSGGY